MRVNTRLTTLFAVACAVAVAAPAIAQDAMSSGSMGNMSAMEMKKMKKCNAMSHDAMMKSASCMKMMKAHPDMMHGDTMMSQ